MDINTKKADLQAAEQRAIETLDKISSGISNKKNNAITAEEALAIANSSDVVKKRISKIIREVATEGALQATYGLEHPSRLLVNSIVEDLTKRGFNVTVTEDEDFAQLIINWNI
jgi:hypothetical protein